MYFSNHSLLICTTAISTTLFSSSSEAFTFHHRHHQTTKNNKFSKRSTELFQSSPTSLSSNDLLDIDANALLKEGSESLGLFAKYFSKSLSTTGSTSSDVEKNSKVTAIVEEIIQLCDEIDQQITSMDNDETQGLTLRAIRYGRYSLLQSLMRVDYDSYVKVASFLSPIQIPRDELPNVQDIPFVEASGVDNSEDDKSVSLTASYIINGDNKPTTTTTATPTAAITLDENSDELVPDCELPDKSFDDNPLDKLLLKIFRDRVVVNSNGEAISEKEGIFGLLEQGRSYMIKPGQTEEAQHKMVRDTLGDLLTPVMPPVYRLFMSGIIPDRVVKFFSSSEDGEDNERKEVQIGPLFYAPWFTTIVTPIFFAFLVGPSRPNARKDGKAGGLVVEKCKFLQESGCKGLCLHQCKIPAQEFFMDTLGMPLTVSPNFETQECQWSFGEVPLPPEEDPLFPTGCLVGCESRKQMALTGGASNCA